MKKIRQSARTARSATRRRLDSLANERSARAAAAEDAARARIALAAAAEREQDDLRERERLADEAYYLDRARSARLKEDARIAQWNEDERLLAQRRVAIVRNAAAARAARPWYRKVLDWTVGA